MRVLFATTAGAGHLGPMVPFASSCGDAGHDVAVAAPASFGAHVEALGFPHLPFADAPEDEWQAVMASLPGRSHEDANATVIREVFGRIDTRAALPGMRQIVADWNPDLVVRDPCEFSSYLVADDAGLPHVQVAIGLAWYDRLTLQLMGDVLPELGAQPGLASLVAAPRLTLLPSSFEDPDAPGRGWQRYRNPEHAPAADGLPDWWGGSSDPLVYVTFGTVAPGLGLFPDLYRAAVEVLRPLPVRVLVTVGRDADPGELGALPANVHVERWVPQAQALAHAAVLVSHGGFGTTLGGLSAGVPQVVLPLFADQPANALRVEAVGAGVAVGGGAAGAAELADAVGHVLGDDRFRRGARRIADEIAALAPVSDATAALEAMV